VIIGRWVGEFDTEQADRVLRGEDPFDETTMLDDEDGEDGSDAPAGPVREPQPVGASV
jgi:aerobic C4-dicarboxylate transport protein